VEHALTCPATSYRGRVPHRSPLALAALADAAVRDLDPVAVRPGTEAVEDLDVAEVTDSRKRCWTVRAPRSPVAATRIEREIRLLAEVGDQLPFAVPRIAGTANLPGGGRAVVHPVVPGQALDLEALAPRASLTAALGRAVAAVHDLPLRLVEEAGLPVYSAEEHRTRHLAEVDRAASTGSVPVPLLARWERLLEEAGAWRFIPCVVHGDLAADNVLVDGEQVSGILDWGEVRIADPADDLGWLAVGAGTDVLSGIVKAYAKARRERPDGNLSRRARFTGELAMARWLLHGVAVDDATVVDDAVHMLTDLELAVGGRKL